MAPSRRSLQGRGDRHSKAVQDLQDTRASLLATAGRTSSRTGPLDPAATPWNLPFARNPFFTSRDAVLSALHTTLTSTRRAAITQPQALRGLGGIGKTQLAIEYAYRYQADYRAVFWVCSSTREELLLYFSAIATLLELPEKGASDQSLTSRRSKGGSKPRAGGC